MSILSFLLGYETKTQKKLKAIELKIKYCQSMLCTSGLPKNQFEIISKQLSDAYCEIYFLRINL